MLITSIIWQAHFGMTITFKFNGSYVNKWIFIKCIKFKLNPLLNASNLGLTIKYSIILTYILDFTLDPFKYIPYTTQKKKKKNKTIIIDKKKYNF